MSTIEVRWHSRAAPVEGIRRRLGYLVFLPSHERDTHGWVRLVAIWAVAVQ